MSLNALITKIRRHHLELLESEGIEKDETSADVDNFLLLNNGNATATTTVRHDRISFPQEMDRARPSSSPLPI